MSEHNENDDLGLRGLFTSEEFDAISPEAQAEAMDAQRDMEQPAAGDEEMLDSPSPEQAGTTSGTSAASNPALNSGIAGRGEEASDPSRTQPATTTSGASATPTPALSHGNIVMPAAGEETRPRRVPVKRKLNMLGEVQRPLEHAICGICSKRGHHPESCSENLSCGFHNWCVFCSTGAHVTATCPRVRDGLVSKADMFHYAVANRSGRPPLRLPFNWMDIDPRKLAEWIRQGRALPQSAKFAAEQRKLRLKAGMPEWQDIGSVIRDPIYNDPDWRNKIGDQTHPSDRSLAGAKGGKYCIPDDATQTVLPGRTKGSRKPSGPSTGVKRKMDDTSDANDSQRDNGAPTKRAKGPSWFRKNGRGNYRGTRGNNRGTGPTRNPYAGDLATWESFRIRGAASEPRQPPANFQPPSGQPGSFGPAPPPPPPLGLSSNWTPLPLRPISDSPIVPRIGRGTNPVENQALGEVIASAFRTYMHGNHAASLEQQQAMLASFVQGRPNGSPSNAGSMCDESALGGSGSQSASGPLNPRVADRISTIPPSRTSGADGQMDESALGNVDPPSFSQTGTGGGSSAPGGGTAAPQPGEPDGQFEDEGMFD
ncbi:hypothetical protein G7Y89_g1714 [Cudoniella acicularis]|uniref:Uncharacterized protein n=1 Tax=Cudoniella acicularis TaxID=354080 RepID=A0A8H4RVI3_9HELO|nr:hypothetical protein G7Y89_g1714 [Cudoniella acicularis]